MIMMMSNRKMMSASGRNSKPSRVKKFIYDLPHKEYKDVEDMLNMNDVWESLAGDHLQMRVGEIDKMRRFNNIQGTSAAKALLDYLSNKNTTIQDLFLLLHKVELYRGMDILKQYVPEKLHHLIKTGPVMLQSPAQYNSVAPAELKTMPRVSMEDTRSVNISDQYLRDDPATTREASFPVQQHYQQHQHYQQQQQYSQYPPSYQQFTQLESLERQRHLSETSTEPGSSVSSARSGYGVPVLKYEDIAAACNNWNPTLKIGEGGFGQVFKGVWKHQEVAIKTIKKDKYLVNDDHEHRNKSITQCFKEINLLNRIRSEFIVPIIAQSEPNFNGFEPFIVYQWMPNGSLDDRLQKKNGSRALTWMQRYNIAIGVANGIQFLHNFDQGQGEGEGKQLIHGDIKSANILLDKNFEPKIGDFGLAREVDGGKSKYFVLSTIYGTQFYLPQDFLRSKKLSVKVDTYSFGVIMFDLVTGKRPQTKVGKEYLLDIMRESDGLPQEYVDKSWPEFAVDSQLCKILYNVGSQCTQDRAKMRPLMEEVYQNLKKALRHENTSPSPYELQQRFDSINRNNTADHHETVQSNLIDLSTPTNQSPAASSVLIPSTITTQQQLSNYIPSVISDAVPSADIPVVVNMDSDSTLEHSLENIERDIEDSAALLSELGF